MIHINHIRSTFFEKISEYDPTFSELPPNEKFLYLMTNDNIQIQVAKFVNKAWNIRQDIMFKEPEPKNSPEYVPVPSTRRGRPVRVPVRLDL